jgi:hypothetical protein
MHPSEPNMTRDQAEAAVAQKSYPRVTEAAIKDKIQFVEYTLPSIHNPGLTVCVITMRNGFSVLGKSAPASPANFDPEIGKRYAYDDAFKQLWAFEGYLLRELLAKGSESAGPND